MTGLGSLFGENSTATQFLIWGVAYGLASSVLDPVFTEVRQLVNSQFPEQALSPAALADMVVRNFIDQGSATTEAAMSGINADRFALLVADAGEPPGPLDLATLLARGAIDYGGTGADATTFVQGISEGRLKDKWIPFIQELSVEWPTPADVIQAYIRSQLSEGDALALFKLVRGNPDYFQLQVDTRGNPPSPSQLLELVRRGIIAENGAGPDVLSLQQGIAEGDEKNKWLPAYQALLEYLPPPRTITALERDGAITPAQAQQYYQDAGLSPDLAAAYSKSATLGRTAANKTLAKSEVLTLYQVGALSEAQATTYLGDLGYQSAEIALELSYLDYQREARALNSAVTRIGTLYVGRKITRQTAVNALAALQVTADHAANLLATWDTTSAANVKVLSEAQIAKAFKLSILDQAGAMTELQAIGYTPFDAWVLLSNEMNVALPDRPAQGPGGPAVT